MINIPNILIYIAGILWGIELIPQIIRTYKRKSVKDISPCFFFMCTIAYLIYTVANVMLRNWSIVIAHIPSMICLVVMIVFLVKYRKNTGNVKGDQMNKKPEIIEETKSSLCWVCEGLGFDLKTISSTKLHTKLECIPCKRCKGTGNYAEKHYTIIHNGLAFSCDTLK